jgi:hypothetical protein
MVSDGVDGGAFDSAISQISCSSPSVASRLGRGLLERQRAAIFL